MKWFFGAIAGAIGLPIISFAVAWIAEWLYSTHGFGHPLWDTFDGSSSFVFVAVTLYNAPAGAVLGAVTGLLFHVNDGVTVTIARVISVIAGCLGVVPMLLLLVFDPGDRGLLNGFPIYFSTTLWALWLIQWGLRNHHSPLTTPLLQ